MIYLWFMGQNCCFLCSKHPQLGYQGTGKKWDNKYERANKNKNVRILKEMRTVRGQIQTMMNTFIIFG